MEVDHNFGDFVESLDRLTPSEALVEIRHVQAFLVELNTKLLQEEQKMIKRGLSDIHIGPFWC